MSSIFGNLGQNKPATPNLFGNLGGNNAASSAPQTSSIFGTSQNQQSSAASSNLFGGLGQQSNTNTQTPSLFGGLGGTSQPASSSGGGGLFGSNTTTAAPQPTGSLFGGNNQNQQNTSSSNLFSGLGASTSQPAKSNGLFGRVEEPKPAQSGGLFSAQPQTTQAQSGSLFGAQPQTTQSQTSNLFGGSTLGGQQAHGQNQSQQQQQVKSAAPTRSQPAYFDQLLERGKKRQTAEHGGAMGELPSLQLGLGDIARKVRNLGKGGPSSTPGNRERDTRAHYLLAASGVNTGAALRDLNSFSNETAAKVPVPQAAPLDTDLDGYVENLYRQSSLNLVEQGLEQAKRDFDNFLEENVQMEWDAQRRRIYEHFGLVKKDDDLSRSANGAASTVERGSFGGKSGRRSRMLGASANGMSFGASAMSKSVLGTPSARGARPPLFHDVAEKAPAGGMPPAPEDRMLRDKQDRYSEKVKSLNIARLEEAAYPVLQQFAEVESQPSIEDTSHFVNSYKALAEIVGEQASAQKPSEPGAIKERQYAQDYLDDAPTSKRAFELRKRIINGSRIFLEKQFLTQLEAAVAKNPREANLGGVPTATNKVRAYVRLRSIRKELGADAVELQTLGDDYCWVLIFYLIRAGLVQEAMQYVSENERAIKSMDRNFPNYLSNYARSAEHRLSSDLQGKISLEYSQRARNAPENSLDPYKQACYKVIGRCDLSRRNLENVNQSMEDWVWLQFALAREVNRVEETAAEVFGLEDVRAVIHEIGQRHFVQGGEGAGGHGTYFYLQMLAGQFESAVACLYPHNYMTAVHFGIALNYYGLLRVNDFNSADDLLSYTTRQEPQLSFGRMLGYYTRDFRASNPTAAADYLTLVCLNGDISGEPGKRQTELCHEALRELVLETREFAELLGDIRNDGQRIKGAIEQRLKLIRIDNEQSFLRQITIAAAQIANENGRVTDAVLLYHLAEEYDEVIQACCRAVSEATSVEIGDTPLRLEPLKPRSQTTNGQQTLQQQQQQPAQGSLRLTAVEDPAQLARNMNELYKANSLMFSKIKPANRGLMELLLGISDAKGLVEAGRWATALDQITTLNLLPLTATGRISVIRERANVFNSLPTLVSRNIGNLLIWVITSAGHQREILRKSEFEASREELADRCLQVAKDTMVFAGLIRYKLPGRVFEVLARVGGDVGAY